MAKVIIIHGNGGGTGNDFWIPETKKQLEEAGIDVWAGTMPDNVLSRSKFWLPYIKDDLKADEQTVIIGFSSGAIAAQRYAEEHKLLGSVLVGTYHTDLGFDDEKQSGYFDKTWGWDKIRGNQKWIVQFASTDDEFIAPEESRLVHNKLNTEYHEFTNRGHFMEKDFPELVPAVLEKLR